MTAIQVLIKEIKNLKPIPAVVHPLLEAVDDPNTDMEDVAKIIQYDPAITASVLRTTNSAFFGLRHPAESIKDAANLLGTDQIINLVLLKSGAGIFAGNQVGYDLNEGAMWKYSVSPAIIARQIAKKLKIPHKSSIFTAALLKDISKTILDGFVQDAFEKISGLVTHENLSFMEAEKKGHRGGADGLAYRFHRDAMNQVGISADDVTRIIAEFTCKMQEVEDLLQVV